MSEELQISRIFTVANNTQAKITGPLPIQMHSSDATALELVANVSGKFGADLIRFRDGGRVEMHTHEGDHILFVTNGTGYVRTPNKKYRLEAGVIYFIPSGLPHGIESDHGVSLDIIAIGNDRRPPESKDRLKIVAP